MVLSEDNRLHLLLQRVRAEIEAARFQFRRTPNAHLEADLPLETWMTVLNEEIGKLNRCTNKLRIAKDPNIREKWTKEGDRRIVTSIAVLARLHLVWKDRCIGGSFDRSQDELETYELGDPESSDS